MPRPIIFILTSIVLHIVSPYLSNQEHFPFGQSDWLLGWSTVDLNSWSQIPSKWSIFLSSLLYFLLLVSIPQKLTDQPFHMILYRTYIFWRFKILCLPYWFICHNWHLFILGDPTCPTRCSLVHQTITNLVQFGAISMFKTAVYIFYLQYKADFGTGEYYKLSYPIS